MQILKFFRNRPTVFIKKNQFQRHKEVLWIFNLSEF